MPEVLGLLSIPKVPRHQAIQNIDHRVRATCHTLTWPDFFLDLNSRSLVWEPYESANLSKKSLLYVGFKSIINIDAHPMTCRVYLYGQVSDSHQRALRDGHLSKYQHNSGD